MDGKKTEDEQSISINDMDYMPITKNIKESVRVQKTEYIRQQLKQRQEAEDALLVRLMQEQQVIDSLQGQIHENLEQTELSGKFNKEFKERINSQIYELHGVSNDKLEGMREYKNAYYQGCAAALFAMSAALILLCGFLHGFGSQLCLFMFSYTAVEGALLAQSKKRRKIVDWLCRGLYLLLFPLMLGMFVCYELGYPQYSQFLPYLTAAGIVILIFATLSFFLFNPYRGVKRNVREAKAHISDIEKIAGKEVKRNLKKRRREEKRMRKKARREERSSARRVRRESRWYAIRRFFRLKKEWLMERLHRKDTAENVSDEACQAGEEEGAPEETETDTAEETREGS